MKVFSAIWHLAQGLGITMLNFLRPKVTEQYPENRATKVHFERFRAEVVMPHDEDNHHRCTACGICAATCPNKTIEVLAGRDEAGKRVLDKHLYDVGGCMFCGLCVAACPFGAIEFSNEFEHAVFTRSVLQRQLNKPGSSLKKRENE